jgi:hypothetical protein
LEYLNIGLAGWVLVNLKVMYPEVVLAQFWQSSADITSNCFFEELKMGNEK